MQRSVQKLVDRRFSLFSVRPLNNRELEVEKEPKSILHCENGKAVMVRAYLEKGSRGEISVSDSVGREKS